MASTKPQPNIFMVCPKGGRCSLRPTAIITARTTMAKSIRYQTSGISLRDMVLPKRPVAPASRTAKLSFRISRPRLFMSDDFYVSTAYPSLPSVRQHHVRPLSHTVQDFDLDTAVKDEEVLGGSGRRRTPD